MACERLQVACDSLRFNCSDTQAAVLVTISRYWDKDPMATASHVKETVESLVVDDDHAHTVDGKITPGRPGRTALSGTSPHSPATPRRAEGPSTAASDTPTSWYASVWNAVVGDDEVRCGRAVRVRDTCGVSCKQYL